MPFSDKLILILETNLKVDILLYSGWREGRKEVDMQVIDKVYQSLFLQECLCSHEEIEAGILVSQG